MSGNNTMDHIFCLSINEAEHYFGSDNERQCNPTAFARKQGAYVYNDCCFWWLRSPGDGSVRNCECNYNRHDRSVWLRYRQWWQRCSAFFTDNLQYVIL